MNRFVIIGAAIALISGLAFAQESIVINEIYYNPPDDGVEEFIELYNPTTQNIRLGNYTFTEGILFEFPRTALIQPGGYFLVVRDPNHLSFRNYTNKAGPYLGKLADSGERLTLRGPNGQIVDEVEYGEAFPWPRAADGYGRSIEKISPDAPSNDPRSWRASTADGGTPSGRNSVFGEPAGVFYAGAEFEPAHPRSDQRVTVTARFEGASLIVSARLHIQTEETASLGTVSSFPMQLQSEDEDVAEFSASIPPQSSQNIVRCQFELRLSGGERVYWPHPNEVKPFASYFVYDNEIETLLPLLWFYSTPRSSGLPGIAGKRFTAAVIKPLDGPPQEYDGAIIVSSRNGNKLRFLKGEEYEGNRTLNVLPERPGGSTTSGAQTPHVEHISFKIFETFGVLAPGVDWYRVIERGAHTQRLLIQQPNENFLDMNTRVREANIYKVAYNVPNGVQKQTNLDEGQDDLDTMLRAIRSSDPQRREAALKRYLDVEKVMNYSVAGVLMSNWDGFFNNMFLYHAPPPVDKWECIPWDLDKTFGYTDSNPMFVAMPLDYPLDGRAPTSGRPPGLISGEFHKHDPFHEEYKRRMRRELTRRFSIDRIQQMADEYEQLLLDDLDLQTDYTGLSGRLRQIQITESYDTIMEFMVKRHDFLDKALPVSVDDWELH